MTFVMWNPYHLVTYLTYEVCRRVVYFYQNKGNAAAKKDSRMQPDRIHQQSGRIQERNRV